MASSWFLVLIPTKEFEARSQNLNIVDPNNEKLPNITEFQPDSNQNSVVEPNLKDHVKHENTENNNEETFQTGVLSRLYNGHHPPMKIAQHDLNKHNEDPVLEFTYFELDLQEALQILNVSHQATYQLTKNKNFYLVTFCIEASNVEAALICLQNFGIGNTELTSISVIPTSIHIDCPEMPSHDDIVQR